MTAHEERAAIVHWLRSPEYSHAMVGWNPFNWIGNLITIAAGKAFADYIEAGEHWEGRD